MHVSDNISPNYFLEWKIFQINIVEKIKIHILFSETSPQKSCRLWDSVKKFGGAIEAADDNMTAGYMLDK
jgi:hypothetical protein